jgi:hypothetical protein
MAARHWLFNQWKTAIRNVVHIDLQNHLMLNDLIDKIYAIAEWSMTKWIAAVETRSALALSYKISQSSISEMARGL